MVTILLSTAFCARSSQFATTSLWSICKLGIAKPDFKFEWFVTVFFFAIIIMLLLIRGNKFEVTICDHKPVIIIVL
jgi:hypothetical protein